jgi:hypothetical protein
MKPRIDILPAHQRRLWPELSQIKDRFVLYGGTAVALRLGNRQSIDFDFFTDSPISADLLTRSFPFLADSIPLQAEPNTATFSVSRGEPIKVSFFGGLTFGRAGTPDRCDDNGILVASCIDLAAHKLKVILNRAESKDYLDIFALLKAGFKLSAALGACVALFPELNPLLSLKALTYFGEPNLAALPGHIKDFLIKESALVGTIPSAEQLSSNLGLP